MNETTKRAIKKTILALRKLLEKEDIPGVLKQHGIFPDGRRVPIESLRLLGDNGRKRRDRLETVIKREVQAVGGNQKSGIQRYCREVTFVYLNRLVALRCMEVRGLIDECIKIRDDYAGRSLRHHRFLREQPGTQFDPEDTDGLKAVLRAVFRELQEDIRILFDPDDEYSIIMPSLQALRECIRALNEDIPEDAFKKPALIGWVYQYFQTEEKNRVFEEVRTKKRKIRGDDIVPATSLYTERYMVDYLVQNSLGAIWMEMYPDSKLCRNWPYFVRDQDLKPREPRPVKSLTFLDPACGSGHFLLVAFDILAQMYEEEERLAFEGKIPKEWIVPKEKIATTILESNLHGIDIDLRSVQLSYLVLYLTMREHQKSVSAIKTLPTTVNLVAADASLLDTPEFGEWCEQKFRGKPYFVNILKGIASRLHNLAEIGSLARPEEDLKDLVHRERERLLGAWKPDKKQMLLFPELLRPAQQALPFDKITDDEFWDRLTKMFSRMLDVFLTRAKEEMPERVFATDLQRVVVFLDLCRKRYDVVATNPPLLSSKHFGTALNRYLKSSYPGIAYNLSVCFIKRSCHIIKDMGFVCSVAQNSLLFSIRYKEMRNNLFNTGDTQLMVHLGPRAFDDISGVRVDVILIVLTKPVSGRTGTYFKLIDQPEVASKRMALLGMCSGSNRSAKEEKNVFKHHRTSFLHLPGTPILYSASKTALKLLASPELIGHHQATEHAMVREGLHAKPQERFVRYFWEIRNGMEKKWFKLHSGGNYCRWYGNDEMVVDFEDNGKRIREYHDAIVPSSELYFLQGITYSALGGKFFSARLLPSGSIFSPAGPGVFPKSFPIGYALALLNSNLIGYMLSLLNPSINFKINDIGRLPYVKPNEIQKEICNELALLAVELKRLSTSQSTPSSFVFRRNMPYKTKDDIDIQALLHSIEGIIQQKILEVYRVPQRERTTIFEHQGCPAGLFPLVEGYDAFPEIGNAVAGLSELNKEVFEYLNNHKRINPSREDLVQIKSRLRALYEAGPGAKVEDVIEEEETEANDDEGKSDVLIGKRIPTETFLEELSVKMEIHPISIYWFLKGMREKEGAVCWSECKRYVEDYFTVMILRILGFRWPKQIEANELIPEWADRDGVIPITEYTGEKTLHERIRDRIGAEFGENRIADIEAEFADILFNAACKKAEIRGKKPPKKKTNLAQWVEKEFFKRHASQFKKCPIAWSLTSSNGTFQVLLFYHKISLDMLKNLKNRYLAKVESYYETLLDRVRKKETVAAGLTEGKLSDIVAELEEFANKLGVLIAIPYEPSIDDGVRVNVAPFQKIGLLASPVLAPKDVDRAIADRNRWREDDEEQNTVWEVQDE